MTQESVRTVWAFLDYEVPFWVGMVLLVVVYVGLGVLWAWFGRWIRRQRRPRDPYADIPPVTVLPTRPDRRTLEDR